MTAYTRMHPNRANICKAYLGQMFTVYNGDLYHASEMIKNKKEPYINTIILIKTNDKIRTAMSTHHIKH